MEQLVTKQIHGQTYYYYSKWGWVDGKCRRLWQKYLGKLAKYRRLFEQSLNNRVQWIAEKPAPTDPGVMAQR